MKGGALALVAVAVGVGALAFATSTAHAAPAPAPAPHASALEAGRRYIVYAQWPTPIAADAKASLASSFRDFDGFAETDVDPLADTRNVIVFGTYAGASGDLAPAQILAAVAIAPAAFGPSGITLAPLTRYEIEVQTPILAFPSRLLRKVYETKLSHLGFVTDASRELPAASNTRTFTYEGTYRSADPVTLQSDPSLSTFTRASPLFPLVSA